jgi:CDP-diacylglycerol--glycerol-3-phosphate 3-phosphatidyltransferase
LLAATDWFDGKLAVYLNQKSRIGPRLDSIADVMLYACLLIGGAWLIRELLWTARFFVLAAVASYGVSVSASYLKFRRFPAYHTRAAKTSWFLTLAAAVGVLLFEWEWMLLVPLIAVTLTNIEATCITLVANAPMSNVPSIWHASHKRTA